ncbi:hypothetical protein [Streptomyces alfalfae]
MPKNTVTTPLAPMELDDVADAFAYIRALQTGDIDTACAVADDTGPELHRLLLDVAARVFIPVTAVDDCDGEPCAHSFLAAALGRLLLELLSHGVCLGGLPGIADTITRFAENILTDDHGDVADVLRQLEAAGMKQAMGVHSAPAGAPVERTTGVSGAPRPSVVRIVRAPPTGSGCTMRAVDRAARIRCARLSGGAVLRAHRASRRAHRVHRTPGRCGAPRAPRGSSARIRHSSPSAGGAGSYITHPLDLCLIESRDRLWQRETLRYPTWSRRNVRPSRPGQGVTDLPPRGGQGGRFARSEVDKGRAADAYDPGGAHPVESGTSVSDLVVRAHESARHRRQRRAPRAVRTGCGAEHRMPDIVVRARVPGIVARRPGCGGGHRGAHRSGVHRYPVRTTVESTRWRPSGGAH